MRSAATTDALKRNGVHYTPPELARFLARALIQELPAKNQAIKVLDPACGEGALLEAFVVSLAEKLHKKCILVGYETDPTAARRAREKLLRLGIADVTIHVADFLMQPAARGHQTTNIKALDQDGFNAVITNPPYVRTQVMGSIEARRLAKEFDLTGRVDLYHAFIRASANVLNPSGVLGLLTSNRFLTIKSGESTRKLLQREFALKSIFDLGDTKLFKAAVLPVVVVARRPANPKLRDFEPLENCSFDRVYKSRESND